MSKILILRHSDREEINGFIDVFTAGINSRGKIRAESTARILKKVISGDILYLSSWIGRCEKTAEYMSNVHPGKIFSVTPFNVITAGISNPFSPLAFYRLAKEYISKNGRIKSYDLFLKNLNRRGLTNITCVDSISYFSNYFMAGLYAALKKNFVSNPNSLVNLIVITHDITVGPLYESLCSNMDLTPEIDMISPGFLDGLLLDVNFTSTDKPYITFFKPIYNDVLLSSEGDCIFESPYYHYGSVFNKVK